MSRALRLSHPTRRTADALYDDGDLDRPIAHLYLDFERGMYSLDGEPCRVVDLIEDGSAALIEPGQGLIGPITLKEAPAEMVAAADIYVPDELARVTIGDTTFNSPGSTTVEARTQRRARLVPERGSVVRSVVLTVPEEAP